MVEQFPLKESVVGSTPSWLTTRDCEDVKSLISLKAGNNREFEKPEK